MAPPALASSGDFAFHDRGKSTPGSNMSTQLRASWWFAGRIRCLKFTHLSVDERYRSPFALITGLNSALESSDRSSRPLAPSPSEDTSLARMDEKLRESEERFRGMFEEAPVACHEIDRDGIVLRVNLAGCKLLGFEQEEMLGRYIWDFAISEEREKSREVIRQRIAGESEFMTVEREYSRHDGARLTLEIHSTAIRNAAGQIIGIRSFLLDITERKRAQQALQSQAEDLARSNAELGQFAYVASHDLQEPLRKILAFGDRLKKKHAEALGAEGRDYLERMQNAAGRMQTLINDLLSLSRVTNHRQPFAAVDLAEVVRMVVSDLETRLLQVNGKVELAALPIIVADRGQMAQLFQNLIGNGLKFGKPGQPPVVRVYGELFNDQQGGAAGCQIVVEDNGIGFDEKYLDRIFRVFQRLHGRTEYDGTGIGLAICRKIVERHSGSITARSTPGMGAKFIVTLPYRPLSEETK
jgi:PAS domain S-box-containing protein